MRQRALSKNAPAVVMVLSLLAGGLDAGEADLLGHWKLAGDTKDHSGNGHDGRGHGVDLEAAGPDGSAGGATGFDGRTSVIEIPDAGSLRLGTGEFSIAVRVNTAAVLDDVLGDIANKFDPASRRGFNFDIQTFAGVTTSQSNSRHVHFGIDSGHIDPEWTDRGRPGNNLFVFSLCVFRGELYAGTFETGAHEAGHVYRYGGGTTWIDCGSPHRSNTVQSLAVYGGKLYAGVGHYMSRGSALPDSANLHPGGRVYRYEGEQRWVDCGKLENPENGASFTVGGMVEYHGQLYAGVSKPPGRGMYRYDGAKRWTYCGNPGHRVTNPVVFDGRLYLCSLDGGAIARYDGGRNWTPCGKPKGSTQTYGFAIHRGELYASTWPLGEVFLFDGDKKWINRGRLGAEREVMGMAVYNGKLYAGTLPLAEVYRHEGGTEWTRTGQLDTTPDVRYRRAWSMAVFRGQLFCGTLPSGHVYSIEAGKSVTHDHALPAGWTHLAAVRERDRLKLYVNGRLAATSSTFNADDYDISNAKPLMIGFGAHDNFNGSMRDLRIYGRALSADEIQRLAR